MFPRCASSRHLGRFCLFWLATLIAVGCSKNERDAGTAAVSGKVTYNGQALAGATVSFISDTGLTPGATMSAADGAYSLRVKPGSYTVTVSKVTGVVDTKQVSMEEAMANADKSAEEPKESLPSKYQDPLQSPLKFEVKASGTNTFDASLTD